MRRMTGAREEGRGQCNAARRCVRGGEDVEKERLRSERQMRMKEPARRAVLRRCAACMRACSVLSVRVVCVQRACKVCSGRERKCKAGHVGEYKGKANSIN